ncbi:transposase, partial [Paraburkholderia aspalathi]|uniref:transposase n=1 Tax=Paraburkholderia aspalathi TaxID=1324617 RepID=UPI002467C9CC
MESRFTLPWNGCSLCVEYAAFRYIAANTHPDHDTLATFRKRFASRIEKLFVQVLLV